MTRQTGRSPPASRPRAGLHARQPRRPPRGWVPAHPKQGPVRYQRRRPDVDENSRHAVGCEKSPARQPRRKILSCSPYREREVHHPEDRRHQNERGHHSDPNVLHHKSNNGDGNAQRPVGECHHRQATDDQVSQPSAAMVSIAPALPLDVARPIPCLPSPRSHPAPPLARQRIPTGVSAFGQLERRSASGIQHQYVGCQTRQPRLPEIGSSMRRAGCTSVATFSLARALPIEWRQWEHLPGSAREADQVHWRNRRAFEQRHG